MRIKQIEDILSLIAGGIEESTVLDYKRELTKNNDEIAKDISAFANTEGGMIIYGVNEKDKRPVSLSWIVDNGVDERIHNIIDSMIDPKISGLDVIRLSNPDNINEAIFVINISKSPGAPHMTKGRYHKKYGSTNRVMNNTEVKETMLGSGRLTALTFEIETNIKIMNQLLEITRVPGHDSFEVPIIAVPFHTDVWKSMIASGYVSVLNKYFADALFHAYGLLEDINALLKIAMEDNTRFQMQENMRFALSIKPLSKSMESSLGDAIRNYCQELHNSIQHIIELKKYGIDISPLVF